MNTLGAAAGALLAGLVLIEWFGLRGSVLLAAGVNLAVGCAALALGARQRAEHGGEPQASDESIPTNLPYWVTGCVLLLSGFATIAYEIIWFRALRYLFGNSTYALSMMLVVFLIGLGLGAFGMRPLARRGLAERALGLSQLAIAVLALFAIAFEAGFLESQQLLKKVSVFYVPVWDKPWWERLAIECGVALAMMLPAVLFMGLSFPLGSRLFLGSVERLGRRVGIAYLLANLGSISGSVVAALVLLPQLGTVNGTRLLAALNLALGVLVLAHLPGRVRLLGGAAAAGVLALVIDTRIPDRLPFAGSGVDLAIGKLLFEEEGDLATVQVRHMPDAPGQRGMSIDGTSIGVNGPWHFGIYSKQIQLAHLPLALDQRLRTTLNVGLGSASTLRAMADYDRLETLEVVEISGAVVRGARLFADAVVLKDPRTRVVVEDVFHHLLRTPQRYDLIVADGKQNRDFSGNAKMLSREFYEHALDRLAPSGMLVQWIPLGTLAQDYRILLRTFLAVFPEAEVFHFPPGSTILVGSRQPIVGRPGLPDADLPLHARHDLGQIGLDGVTDLRAAWVVSGDQLRRALGDGPQNTWNHLRLEFPTYRARNQDWIAGKRKNLALFERARSTGPSPAQSAFAPPDSPAVRIFTMLREADTAAARGDFARARELVRAVLEKDPDHPVARRIPLRARGRTQHSAGH